MVTTLETLTGTAELVGRREELISRLTRGLGYIDDLKLTGQDSTAAEMKWLTLLTQYCTVEQELIDRGYFRKKAPSD